jgi:5-methylcytosine-specific restriction endonuclease McrA
MNAEARAIWSLRFTERPASRRCPLDYDAYRRYLRSGHWRRLRARVRSRARDRCERCGAERGRGVVVEVHHLTYERLGQERDGDLQLLCQSCHADAHVAWEPFVDSDVNAYEPSELETPVPDREGKK